VLQFGARDDTWNPEGRKSHSLRTVERRVLKGGDSDQSIVERGGKSWARDIDLVRQHGVDALR
jgi:hypothetical protein